VLLRICWVSNSTHFVEGIYVSVGSQTPPTLWKAYLCCGG
jgi:hypothetical protein